MQPGQQKTLRAILTRLPSGGTANQARREPDDLPNNPLYCIATQRVTPLNWVPIVWGGLALPHNIHPGYSLRKRAAAQRAEKTLLRQ